MQTKEIVGLRVISQRPAGKKTIEVINYDVLVNHLTKYQEFDILNAVQKAVKINSKGQVTFTSGCGYDIISFDLLSNRTNDNVKSDLYARTGIDFISVGRHTSIKNKAQFFKERKRVLKEVC